jgi:FkbM family methyltransferase
MVGVTVMGSKASVTSQFEHLAALLKTYETDCVLDVGAHVGEFGSALRHAGYSGPIVSFEPVNDCFNRLEAVAARDPKWWVYRAALGRDTGDRPMNVIDGTGSSFLSPNQYAMRCWPEWHSAYIEKVPMRRLSEMMEMFLPRIGVSRPFLKLDTQGYDVEVFQGAGNRIHDLIGLQCELSLIPLYEGMPTIEDALGVFRAAGFDVTGFFPVAVENATGRLLEVDCVMIRSQALPTGIDRTRSKRRRT